MADLREIIKQSDCSVLVSNCNSIRSSIRENFYSLGPKAGTLTQLFTRNKFTLCEKICLHSATIPNNEISIR